MHGITFETLSRLVQQLHNTSFKRSYDDLADAVTKSASKKAEMKLLDTFVLAFEYIKTVSETGH